MNKPEKKGLVPELRFPEFGNKEWKFAKINDVASIVTDYVANGSFQSLRENVVILNTNEFAYYIRLSDLRAGLGHKDQKYVVQSSYDFLKKSALHGGELLIANIGANVGEVWQMPMVDKPATLAPNMIMIKFKTNVSSNYIYYLLDSENGQDSIAKAIGGGAHPKINKTDLKQVIVVLPTTSREQQKIADCLTAIDELITAQTQKLDTLKTHKKGLMQQLFPAEGETLPKLRFPEFWDQREWDEKALNELTTYVDYRGRSPAKCEHGIFLVTAKNIKHGYIDYDISKEYVSPNDYENVMKKGKPEKGDVLITTEAPLGNIAQIDREYIALAQRVIKFRSRDFISNDYLKYYMLGGEFQGLLRAKAIGSTVQGIQGKVLHQLPIKFPCGLEQQKIANCLTSLDALITAQAEKIDTLKTHKKGLMQQLFPTPEANG
ncbi:restriction endonuclease subunit S [Candidatus Venteria ishoeyi]|uniref:restriction endonuclease subunit S n=1 Tax=Candidatus Venteria ishoeyi TaxID=1899563 RepID=UPI0025A5150D|nr:restriction endonuclease subunit S [Candidatus Venteria ishoeyi]MDM8547105.1 restriction endonuclease subunit S [Candidatus Venteria ishoeyi]